MNFRASSSIFDPHLAFFYSIIYDARCKRTNRETMEYFEKDFGKILKANALKQRRLMLKYDTDCMRVYDRNLEEFPVTVDLYGKYARITDYSRDGMDDPARETCCDIAGRMLYIEKDHVIFYHREKREGREQHGILSDTSVVTTVKENGLTFTVDLTKRIDTGLFLDHAVTRQMVREHSQGLRVLNLFSYTGAFSVYAMGGGARSVVSVDLSATYTDWARKNLQDNGFSGEACPCVAMDAWKYVGGAVRDGKKFDLIIFDPPAFSNSHKMDSDFDVQRDYARWLRVLNVLLADDGLLLFSNNLGSFQLDKRLISGFDVREITWDVAAPGFAHKKGTARTWLLAKTETVRLHQDELVFPPMNEAAEMQQDVVQMSEEEKKQEGLDEAAVTETDQHVEQEAPKAKKTTKKSTKTTKSASKKTEAPEDEVKTDAEAPAQPEAEAPASETVEPSADSQPEAEEKADDDVLTLHWSDDEPKTAKNAEDESEADASEDAEPETEEDRMAIAKKAFQPRPYGQGRKDHDDQDEDAEGEEEEDADAESSDAGDEDSDRRGGDRGGYGRRDDDRRGGYGDRGGYGRRDDSRGSYGDRGGYGRRDDDRRGGYGDRGGYGRRDDSRGSYGDRGGYGRRDDDRRGGYGDRGGYGRRDDSRGSYGDRGGYGRRDDDRRGGYGDRGGYGRRDDSRGSYGDRGGYGRRDDSRGSYGDRGGYGRRDDDRRGGYGDRGGYGRRDDSRGSYGDRGGYGRRDDSRGSYGDRGGYGRRDDSRGGYGDRGGFGRRDDNRRGGFGGDRGFSRPDRYSDDRRGGFGKDRPDRKPKPYGFDKFRDTKTRGENENDNFFWLDDDKKNKKDDT
jgi:23S rRNA G2069 N7-methylase RlmK/C1962 C5-methylase RlmI